MRLSQTERKAPMIKPCSLDLRPDTQTPGICHFSCSNCCVTAQRSSEKAGSDADCARKKEEKKGKKVLFHFWSSSAHTSALNLSLSTRESCSKINGWKSLAPFSRGIVTSCIKSMGTLGLRLKFSSFAIFKKMQSCTTTAPPPPLGMKVVYRARILHLKRFLESNHHICFYVPETVKIGCISERKGELGLHGCYGNSGVAGWLLWCCYAVNIGCWGAAATFVGLQPQLLTLVEGVGNGVLWRVSQNESTLALNRM